MPAQPFVCSGCSRHCSFAHHLNMARITFSVHVDVSHDDEDWDIVDTPAPCQDNGNDGGDEAVSPATHTDAAAPGQVEGKERIVRLLGKYVIQKRTCFSAARFKEYYMGVRAEAKTARLPTPHTRQRDRRTIKDFVAVAAKNILYKEAVRRWSHMLTWCKLVKADAPQLQTGDSRDA